MWLEIPGFLEKLKGWWRGFVIEGSASFIFVQKLKMLKECIMRWKREEFGRFNSRKSICLKRIEDLNKKGMNTGLNSEEMGEKADAEQKYNQLLKMEEI